MILRRTFTAGLIAASLPLRSTGASHAFFDKPLERAIDAALAERRIVGTVVLVAHKGKLIYQRAAGLADRESGRVMTVDTPFRLASVTKPVTILAAMKMIEQGVLSPRDRLASWLPVFKKYYPDVTIDHLLSHTAGFDYRFQQTALGAYAAAGISDGMDDGDISLGENLSRIASVEPDRAPGHAWRYSVATDVLGGVLEAALKRPLDRIITELVTTPLGLDLKFHWRGAALASAYRDGEPEPVTMTGVTEVPLPFIDGPGVRFDPSRATRADAFPSGGGGMAGRAMDVLTVLEAFRHGPALSPAMRAAAREVRVGPEAQPQGPGWGYAWLGPVLLDPTASQTTLSVGSISWGGVYGHMWAIDFERDLTLLELSNTAFEGMFGQFPRDLKAAVFA
jgi:CubicO group peptidase (beta-lactamase class C family)